MSWLKQTPIEERPARPHHCETPMRRKPVSLAWRPDGEKGDLWMCDDCRKVWTVSRVVEGVHVWQEVFPLRAWWLRRRAEVDA